MAGFKQTILQHSPVMFITFDGDAYDPASRRVITSPPRIMDESGLANHAIVHNENDNFPAYRMGMPSLVHLEQIDQHATAFGAYGAMPLAPYPFPKSFLEVPHNVPLALANNRGSFTLSTMMSKTGNEQAWRNYKQQEGLTYTANITRTIMRKAGIFHMRLMYPWAAVARFEVQHPGGVLSWTYPTAWFYGDDKNHMITFTWDVQEVSPNSFKAVATLYVNARTMARQEYTYSDTTPTSTSSAAVEIGGTINPSTVITDDDRMTSRTILDQIFILNKALTADEVARLFKKTRTYDQAILTTQVRNYWAMSDEESATSAVMQDLANQNVGKYEGGATRVIRRQAGPSQLPASASTMFVNGGAASANYTPNSTYQPISNLASDYSVEFWASFENSSRSVLFSMQRDTYPYGGILVEANVRNGQTQPGHIQFSISAENMISTRLLQDNGQPYNFANGQMHHIVVAHRSGVMELWVDGLLHATRSAVREQLSVPGPGQIYLMAGAPGRLNTTGRMANVALYEYAIEAHIIRMRYLFNGIYRLQGRVTLQGIPHQATIRAMKNFTGELVREVVSDNNSGDYTMHLYDNSLIDLVALNKQDRNVRYRVYGPITPAYYGDTP